MFSFQGAFWVFFKRLNEAPSFEEPSVNLLSSSLVWIAAGQNKIAFLRKSHVGRDSPPDCCQEPAFQSFFSTRTPYPLFALLLFCPYLLGKWWAKMDSNHRPHDYQSCALASWAIGPFRFTSWCWWRLAGSNRWPPACKAGALPAELNPQIFPIFLQGTSIVNCQLSTVNCQFICAL